ncbi:MAG: spiro-SPASM protein [Spirochaetaceae bacterium]|nr:spiro-SPASM protein [Spirochaetaceae bacterium]
MTIFTNMGNVAVINLIDKNKYSDLDFFQGETVFQRVCTFSNNLPGTVKQVLLLKSDEDYDSSFIKVIKDEWNEEDLFSVFSELTESYENIFYFYGDYPLLDSKLTSRMFENHIKYYAGYTFADGYPLGLSPEILRSQDIKALHQLAKGSKKTISRNSIFTVLQKDINAFDIETEISPVDLRMYRISLSCDNKRNSEQLKKFIDSGIVDTASLLEKISDSIQFLRTKPSYFQIQITDSCPHLCSYCPFSEKAVSLENRTSMPLDSYAKLLDKIVALSDDAVIALSAWGEPSLHENFISIAEETIKRESLTLLIETSGLGWDEKILKDIKELTDKYNNPVKWIVSLDALDKDIYRKLRGEGYDEAYKTAHFLLDLFKDNCWVQAVRMNENEENLEDFFRFWKNITENIIIQKYDWFCGSYEQKKITDLSPLKRDPCWHIKRDMFIRINGDVPLCREDLDNKMKLGNIYEDSLEKIWTNGEKIYSDHIKGEYPALCRDCDEYYTFNF